MPCHALETDAGTAMAFDLSVLENKGEFEVPSTYKILTLELDLKKDLPQVELPLYYEQWNWEGDLQPLPNKWYKLIKSCFGSEFCKSKGIDNEQYLLENYVANEECFDPGSFYFITTRSDFCATGFAWYNDTHNKKATLHWLAVDSHHRKIGLGKFVVLSICRKMQENGIQTCVLKTESYRTHAVALYNKLGFKVVNEETVQH